MDGSAPLLDASVWASLRALADGPEFLDELIDVFVSDAQARVDRLCVLLTAGDYAGAGTVAHSLRGSAANIGATEMATLATGLERDLQAGVAVDVTRAEQMREAMQRVVSVMLAHRSHPRA